MCAFDDGLPPAELGTPPFIHPLAGFGDLRMGFYSMVPIVFWHRVVVSLLPPQPLSSRAILDGAFACLTMETACDTKVVPKPCLN